MMARIPSDTLAQLAALRRGAGRAVVATLVSTTGTSPKRDGATMWVDEAGHIVGDVTIGGCIDARVVAAADDVLGTGSAAVIDVALGDDDAWDLGLTCRGSVQVLVEPVRFGGEDGDDIVAALDVVQAEVAAGRRAVTVAPLRGARARLAVREDGSGVGTLGAEALDAEARGAAVPLMRQGGSRLLTLGPERAEYFFSVYVPATRVIIFGAGAVAAPLSSLGKVLGWHVSIADSRERYATPERFPDADEMLIGNLGEIAERLTYDASTMVVMVAHDYKFELPVFRVVLRRTPAYIGLLSSRRRGRALLDFLAEEGFDPDALARIHVPVGLDIGAQTAAEIALSVAAEIVAVRSGASARSMVTAGVV